MPHNYHITECTHIPRCPSLAEINLNATLDPHVSSYGSRRQIEHTSVAQDNERWVSGGLEGSLGVGRQMMKLLPSNPFCLNQLITQQQ